jgi:hypothetical protein
MGAIAMEIIARMPPGDISLLAFRLIDAAEMRAYGGYALSGVISLSWLLHSRYQRRTMMAELKRIAEEKTRLQEQLLGTRVKSSEDPT